jgi:hypothetical protein
MAMKRYVRLEGRALVRVSGTDARPFLQGLISNDIERASPGRAIYAALLIPQGKYLFDFFICELGGAILLDCERERRDALVKRLASYRLRSQVTIAPEDSFEVFAVFGDGAAAALGLDGTAGNSCPFAAGLAFVDPRLSAAGVRAVLPSETGAKALEDAGVERADFADYDAARLRLGLPDGSRDLEIERSLLLENGFEELNGVDFAKGCYVGQEVTTRMKRRALVRKRLMPVAIEGPAPEPGTIVMRDGIEVGEMRSAAGGAGLALLRLDLVDGAATLAAGKARITPRAPAWLAN